MKIANIEMANQWDGEEGDDWTEHAERYDATDQFIWQEFRARIAVAENEHVVDIGCGTGKSTRELARAAPRGRVVGIDLSSRMLDYARRRSDDDGLVNVEYVQGDAQVHPFAPNSFDLGVSVFGAMFFDDPAAAFRNIRNALRPGARLALLAWQPFARNEWLRLIFDALDAGRELPRPAEGLPGPFGLADRYCTERWLSAAGFGDVEVIALHAPMWVGRNAADAWEFVSTMGIVRGLTEGLDGGLRRKSLDNLRDKISALDTGGGVVVDAAEWIFAATA